MNLLPLLPSTAAAFEPRWPPSVVMGKRIGKTDRWLADILRRTSTTQHISGSLYKTVLEEQLGLESAIWPLCSLILPTAVGSAQPYSMLHIEGYVVHVDLVSSMQVAFKLTDTSTSALINYHCNIYSVDVAARLPDWPDKEQDIGRLQDAFVHAAYGFVFRTDAHALETLDEDGRGELLQGRADQVKKAIFRLFVPLRPPPPPPLQQFVDVYGNPLLPDPESVLPSTKPSKRSLDLYWAPSSGEESDQGSCSKRRKVEESSAREDGTQAIKHPRPTRHAPLATRLQQQSSAGVVEDVYYDALRDEFRTSTPAEKVVAQDTAAEPKDGEGEVWQSGQQDGDTFSPFLRQLLPVLMDDAATKQNPKG